MTQKTWFLPPHFDFLPDGELALGTVIPYPSRPTLALASLNADSHPEIVLPDIQKLIESGHKHTVSSKRSLVAEFFARVVEVASTSASFTVSRHNSISLGEVDLETRVFRKPPSEASLRAILELDKVKEHVESGLFGKRPLYIVTGLRVAVDSFQVTKDAGSTAAVSTGASNPQLQPAVPVNVGGKFTVDNERSKTDSYMTAPGVIFAYRLHVIRLRRSGVETEMFSHRTAFMTGEDEGEEEEWECAEVGSNEVDDDLEEDSDCEEYDIGEGAESFIAFK